jgi:hypothetical protein
MELCWLLQHPRFLMIDFEIALQTENTSRARPNNYYVTKDGIIIVLLIK